MGVNQNQNCSRIFTNCPTSRTKRSAPEDDPEAEGEQHLNDQHRNDFKENHAREIARNDQKQHEQTKMIRKLMNAEAVTMIGKQIRGKLSFKNVGVGQKNVDQTIERFRKQPPG